MTDLKDYSMLAQMEIQIKFVDAIVLTCNMLLLVHKIVHTVNAFKIEIIEKNKSLKYHSIYIFFLNFFLLHHYFL